MDVEVLQSISKRVHYGASLLLLIMGPMWRSSGLLGAYSLDLNLISTFGRLSIFFGQASLSRSQNS
jgi:hypothetical protein